MPETVKAKSKQNTMPQALVIGGAGFIGSYVCESLLAQNLRVIAVDDLSSGKEEYIEPLKKDKNFQFMQLDIDKTPLPEFPDAKYIFHIGGIESYINGVDLSLKTMLVNSIGTYNILELARKNNARLLLASSLDIYSGVLSSLNLKNYFGQSDRDAKKYTHHEAKRYAEALVTEYYRKYELDVRIVRVADVYGPRMDLSSGTEISQLFQEAINADALTIHGDGLKVIHPTFVIDVVAGITKAMFTEGTMGKIYNITSHDEINVLNFAYVIQKNSTKPLKIQFTQEYKEVKFPLHKAEIQQTESELAWNAKTKLPEGVTQTLEYFFLKKPVEKKVKKPEAESKLAPKETPNPVENSKKTASTILLENMSNNEIKPLPHTDEAEKVDPKKQKHSVERASIERESAKVNKWNALILSTSVFVVLTLFLFPMFTLFTTNEKSIASTLDTLSQETLESAINAQRNIYFGNVQYNNLEWFFNTVQKREAFENSRASLQALDKLNSAIAVQSKLKDTATATILTLLQGIATQQQIEVSKQQLTTSFLSIQNAVIENETASQKLQDGESELLFSQNATKKLNEILAKSTPLLKKYERQSSTLQNVIQFLSPSQNKGYMILIHDTLYPNTADARIIGYAYFQLGKTGATQVTVQPYVYKTEETTINDAIKDIVDSNRTKGWLPLSAIFTANTTMLKELVRAEESITITNLAQIINANNLEEKLLENRSNSEFQFSIWKEGLKNMISASNDKLSKIGDAVYNGILHEDIKMVTQDAQGTLLSPLCDTQRVLQRNFINTDESLYPNPDSGTPYCVALQEKQISQQNNGEMQKKINITANSANQYKLTYTIKNNSKTTFSEDAQISIAGTPELTNLELVFPLSLDKAQPEVKATHTTYTINVVVEPGAQKDLVLEWTGKKSEANITESGIYIAKPYGAIMDEITVTINTDKPITKKEQNTDLYLNPTS